MQAADWKDKRVRSVVRGGEEWYLQLRRSDKELISSSSEIQNLEH